MKMSQVHLSAGMLKAHDYGKSCAQAQVELDPTFDIWYKGIEYDEDCLYLNIWVPRPKREKRAVMVS